MSGAVATTFWRLAGLSYTQVRCATAGRGAGRHGAEEREEMALHACETTRELLTPISLSLSLSLSLSFPSDLLHDLTPTYTYTATPAVREHVVGVRACGAQGVP
mmetsp:Transcript_8241/g.23506  ORF Transcript_8241/g.23506 Transcript_8241/m.23506 type:complete len:104 (-) Transcript_8241:1437-1748(-)